METLEFIIHPDGRVQEKVTGIIGTSCTEVTAAIEAQLGRVLTHEPTSEFFAVNNQLNSVVNTQTAHSEW
jgi:flavin-binding protein dodecin